MPRYVSPVETITDINGAPMVGAKLVFYEVGTTTKKTIYSDAGLTTPRTNPVTAVSSDAGAIYPDIYLDGIYKVVQQDDSGIADTDDGAILWTRDPVGDITTGNFELWLNDETYNVPDVVYASDDNYYISLTDANQGNEPSASPAQWQLIPVKDMASRKQIIDDNGNEIVIFSGVASAVNEVTITNAATGNRPTISTSGEADIGLDFENDQGEEMLELVATPSAVNNVRITNATTGNAAIIDASETDSDLDFARNGTGEITVDSVPIYGLVILDTPELLVSTNPASSAWNTVDSATLNTANAVKAILKMYISTTEAAISAGGSGYLRKTGSALAQGVQTMVCIDVNNNDSAAGSTTSYAIGETTINLDSNSDFDWSVDSAIVDIAQIYLIGYYV